MKQSRFLDLAIGTNDVLLFLMCIAFAIIGMAIILLVKSKKRDVNSQGTPFQFSGWFLLLDNLKEVVLSFLLVLMALRFSVEYAGVELTVWYSFVVGLSFQKLSGWVSKLELKARE
jgi:hypothetical protein